MYINIRLHNTHIYSCLSISICLFIQVSTMEMVRRTTGHIQNVPHVSCIGQRRFWRSLCLSGKIYYLLWIKDFLILHHVCLFMNISCHHEKCSHLIRRHAWDIHIGMSGTKFGAICRNWFAETSIEKIHEN